MARLDPFDNSLGHHSFDNRGIGSIGVAQPKQHLIARRNYVPLIETRIAAICAAVKLLRKRGLTQGDGPANKIHFC